MKKLSVVVAVVFASIFAQASYLNWQVNNDDGGSDISKITWAEWTSANLVKIEIDKDGKITSKTTIESQTKVDDGEGHVFTYTDAESIDGIVSGYSYYIELVNSSGTVGYGETMTYAQLESGNYLSTTLEAVPQASTWHGGTFKETPEPTSAMLMLIGVAGLALKRKQRKLA